MKPKEERNEKLDLKGALLKIGALDMFFLKKSFSFPYLWVGMAQYLF